MTYFSKMKRGRSSPKSPPKTFDYFEHIPIPALQEVLLQLDRNQLHYVCTHSRQAAKICREEWFKEQYDDIHRNVLVEGEFQLHSHEPARYHPARNMIFMEDESHNELRIEYDPSTQYIDQLEYRIWWEGHHTIARFYIYSDRALVYNDDDFPIEDLLVWIGKEEWINEFTLVPDKDERSRSLTYRISQKGAQMLWDLLQKRAWDALPLVSELWFDWLD